MKRSSFWLVRGMLLAAAFVCQVAFAVPTTVIVTDSESEGWFGMDQAGAATGDLTTTNPRGAGTGSLEFTTSGSTADIINAARIPLVKMSDIVEIGYDFYTDDAVLAPSLKVQYWNPQRFGTLIYEPIDQGVYPVDTWNTVDGTVGVWYSTEFGPSTKMTFAEWQAELGDIPVTFLQVGVGSGWSIAITGFADLIHLNAAGNDIIWDFEGEETLPPPPQVVVTVDDTDAAGWFRMDQAGGATGELTTTQPHGPGNTGSLEFMTTGNTADVIHAARVPLVRMSEIIEIGYDYRTNDTTFGPALKLQYWNAQRFGTLVYDPANQGPVSVDTWVTADASAGRWWSTEFGGDDIRTFDEWQTELGDILVTFLQTGVGSGWSGATNTFVDSVYLITAGTNTLWDFEGEEQLPLPPQEIVTVDADNPEGWFVMDQAGAGTGELSTEQPHGPGGTGSLEFNTTGDTADAFHVARIPLMLLTDIAAIGYDFWSDNATNAPALKVQYWSTQHFGTLVYEPYRSGSYPTNSWNNVDATQGLWWSTEFGGNDLRTLAEWQATLGDMLVNFLQVGVGSSWSAATQSFADLVYVATSGSNTMWDFEGSEVLPPPPLEVITVDDSNANGWFPLDQAGSATGELSADQPRGPGNTGSLKLTTSGDTADIINITRIPVVSLEDISFVGYDFFTDNASLAPSIKLQYFSADRFGTLVYEPRSQGAYPVDTWNTVDASAGLWYSTEFGSATKQTLAEWQDEIGGILVTFLQVGVGSGWDVAMTGYVDLVQLTTNINNTMWDFESTGELPPPVGGDTVRVNVTKFYSDGSTDPVDVTLTCNGGLPLEQSFTIDGGDPVGVTFTVTEVQSGITDCSVTESGAPDGYLTVMNGGAGCDFEDVAAGALYECKIWNVAVSATFTVFHDNVDDGDGSISDLVDVDIICDTPITDDGAVEAPADTWTLSGTLAGGESLTATLLTVLGDAYCMAEATAQDPILGVTDDCEGRSIAAGVDDECTVTSSLFFEGIPTMSTYGKAFLVLLMLGFGFIGIRRVI